MTIEEAKTALLAMSPVVYIDKMGNCDGHTYRYTYISGITFRRFTPKKWRCVLELTTKGVNSITNCSPESVRAATPEEITGGPVKGVMNP